METYTGFAEVYDLFMEETPYEQWAAFIKEKLEAQGIDSGLVLDLGCGTGRLTRLLAGYGYNMIGADQSEEMLGAAKQQDDDSSEIMYLHQDMRQFELYGTVRAIVSSCDCVNYITEEEELLQIFRLVNNYLDPAGIFFFDFNTKYKYEQIGDCTFAENQDKGSYIWENYYEEEEGINEYDLTIFVRRESGLYEKYEETHFQKAYTLEDIKRLLKQAGLEFITAYDGYENQSANETSERICIMAREHGK